MLGQRDGASDARPAAVGLPRSMRSRAVVAVRQHPLATFYALAFALSWGYWIPHVLSGGHVSHVPGLLGPMVSAFVVTALMEGTDGIKDLLARMARWRVEARWFLWVLLPLGVAVATVGIAALGSGHFPGVEEWSRMQGFPELGAWGTFTLILLVNGYGEETGWRGFALPRVRSRHPELEASVLVAVLWVLWHIPTFFLDTGYRDFPPIFLPAFTIGVFAGAIVLTWLSEGARSSILIASLWHLSLNLGSATKAGRGPASVVVTTAVIVWAIAIARAWRRRDAARADENDRAGVGTVAASAPRRVRDYDWTGHRPG